MTYELDTTFLVQVDVIDHLRHERAVELRDRLLGDGNNFALTPQVLSEYIHIVTDPARFLNPATTHAALSHSQQWWNATEVVRIEAGGDVISQFVSWTEEYSLGRKRILDTMLAATYSLSSINAIVSSNARDYTALFNTVLSP